MLNTTPTYATVETFRAFVRNEDLKDETKTPDDKVEAAILYAEMIIDSYIDYVEPAVEGQALKFPTLNEVDASYVPNEVVLATISFATNVLLEGNVTLNTGKTVQSERWSGTGYAIAFDTSREKPNEIQLPIDCINLLRQWRKKTHNATY